MMRLLSYSVLFVCFLCIPVSIVLSNGCATLPPDSSLSKFIRFHLDFDQGFDGHGQGKASPLNSGHAPSLIKGLNGKAAVFNGGEFLAYSSDQNLRKEEGTFSFWMRIPAVEGNDVKSVYTLFRENGAEKTDKHSLRIEFAPGRFLRAGIRDDAYIYYHKTSTWKPDEWHHVAITWNANKGLFLYVDGRPASTGWFPRWHPVTHKSFQLGLPDAKVNSGFSAAIDEFTIYNKELSAEQVATDFLNFGEFVPEVLFIDPFVEVSMPDTLAVQIDNPGPGNIQLKNVKYRLATADTVVIEERIADCAIPALNKIRLSIPCTSLQPGLHTISLRYDFNGKAYEAHAEVYAMDVAVKRGPRSPRLELIAEVHAARQTPVAENHSSHVVRSALGEYREGGNSVRDRFALDFEVLEENKPHIAIISYPDDKPRTMEVMLQNFGNVIDFQVHSGVMTGEEYPLSGKMLQHKVVFWPRSKRQAFVFMTAENGYPAAVHDIKVYRLHEFGVYDATTDVSHTNRSLGLYYEDPVLFHNFGTTRDLTGFTKATDRLIEYMLSFGQTELEYPLAWYAGPLYGTAVQPFQPDIDGAQGGQRPHPAGYPLYLLKRLGEQNMKFTAGLHIHTLPGLNSYVITDMDQVNAGNETAVNINKDGEFWYGHWHGADPNYNAADIRVMESVNAVVDEICVRYAHEKAFDGISLVMAKPKLFTFGSLASGYNDSNLVRFQNSAGIQIPVYQPGAPDRFAKSYAWLMNNPQARKAWIDWRCKVLFDHYSAMANRMATHRADLKLKLNLFVHLSHNARLANYTEESAREVMREMGIDPMLYKDHPNIVLNHTLVPADYRWKRSHYAPDVHEVNRTVMTAEAVVAGMQESAQPRVTIHDRYWEDAIGREEPLEGLKKLGVNEMVWRASTLNAAGIHAMEPYMFALHHLDALSIVKGGFVIGTYGMEDELREFASAFQSLPAVKFDNVPGAVDPVRIRQKVVNGVLYFYVLNTLPESIAATIFLEQKNIVKDVVSGRSIRKTKKLDVALKPYGLQVYTCESPAQRVLRADVALSKTWTDQLESHANELLDTAKDKEDAEKYVHHLELVREYLSKRMYSRLYFLLQEGWTKTLSEKHPLN